MPRDFPSSPLFCRVNVIATRRRFITRAYSESGLEMRQVQASEFCGPDTLQNIAYSKEGLESKRASSIPNIFLKKETVLTC